MYSIEKINQNWNDDGSSSTEKKLQFANRQSVQDRNVHANGIGKGKSESKVTRIPLWLSPHLSVPSHPYQWIALRYSPVTSATGVSMPRTSHLKVDRRPHSGFLGLRRFKVPSAVVYALFILVIYSHAAPMRAGNLLYDDHIWKRRALKSAARIQLGPASAQVGGPRGPRSPPPRARGGPGCQATRQRGKGETAGSASTGRAAEGGRRGGSPGRVPACSFAMAFMDCRRGM